MAEEVGGVGGEGVGGGAAGGARHPPPPRGGGQEAKEGGGGWGSEGDCREALREVRGLLALLGEAKKALL